MGVKRDPKETSVCKFFFFRRFIGDLTVNDFNFTWTKNLCSDAEKNKLQSELDGYKNQKKSIESDMDKLKVSLYAKFGDQIHLERE